MILFVDIIPQTVLFTFISRIEIMRPDDMQVYNHPQIILHGPTNPLMKKMKSLLILLSLFVPHHFLINRKTNMVKPVASYLSEIDFMHTVLDGWTVFNPL